MGCQTSRENPFRTETYDAEQKTLNAVYPGAMTTHAFSDYVKKTLGKHGFTKESCLCAVSSCPDELNRGLDSMEDAWGESFNLGGLAGMPFTGKTGFGAFSHHVPDGGQLLVVFAPHVGITKDGELGKIQRVGMAKNTTSCGSCMAAYGAACKKKEVCQEIKEKKADDEGIVGDVQQEKMLAVVSARIDEINACEDDTAKIAKLSDIVYEAIKKEILAIIPDDCAVPVALVGGIQINTDYTSKTDFFHVRDVMLRSGPGKSFERIGGVEEKKAFTAA